ncbi:acyl-CoA dehydrogenase family protein [Solirhodobacter olei]|uniref:acyl-CoA dehydrogenase family protein n=1 Tax=Solirhodobacter olei TaxID=2493082 RepID=UPI000FDB7B53|nr:acyl-CoA dehydrogenase family protein [Solirhodobacter olei]
MLPPQSRLSGHEVLNQPDPRGDADLWAADPALSAAVGALGGDARHLAARGRALGTAELRAAGREAMRVPPDLRLFDAGGRRLDEVAFHPAYHRLMSEGLSAGYAALPWTGAAGGHVSHAALVYLHSQVEPGTCCPMTMTYAAVPALAADPALAEVWRPKLISRRYDPAVAPLAGKEGATLGMAMTEKQGGSDVRANATRAEPADGAWRLTGHKWFCSAPMSDGFLTLAQAPGGLTCFLVPRWLESERNAIRLMRLKDKLGNRANASAEIEYDRALAYRLGEEGQGVRTIIEMVHHTRLDTAMAPAGLMRAALTEAHHWASHRTAFQRRLIDQPLMAAVLADLALDWEGATALGLRVAAAFDDPAPGARAFARLAVALAKYLSNKLCPLVAVEAMEVMGGMGYVEDTAMPWLYREAPLNGIWEGSGNVICLDILRTVAKEPAAVAAVDAELDAAKGADRRYDAALAAHRARWPGPPAEAEARWFAESLATLLTAATLIRLAPAAVADGYAATRLAREGGRTPGSTMGLDTRALLARLGPSTAGLG